MPGLRRGGGVSRHTFGILAGDSGATAQKSIMAALASSKSPATTPERGGRLEPTPPSRRDFDRLAAVGALVGGAGRVVGLATRPPVEKVTRERGDPGPRGFSRT